MRGIIRADSSQALDSADEGVFDYTEGASAAEVEDALSNSTRRTRRRDSQVGNSYGYESEGQNEGAVFDGPGYVAIPSSVSRMSHRAMSTERTKQLRRLSSDQGPSIQRGRHRRRSEDHADERPGSIKRQISGDSLAISVDDGAAGGDEASIDGSEVGDAVEGATRRQARRRRDSQSPVMSRSVLDNIAHFFGGKSTAQGESASRRPSLSRRSTGSRSSRRRRSISTDGGSDYAVTEDGDERWGYSSGEDDASEDGSPVVENRAVDFELSDSDYPSAPPSPRSMLPSMAHDQVFGDTRIDVFDEPELLGPLKSGPASRQSVFLPDEDMTVRFTGFTTRRLNQMLWRICCFASFGLLGLLGHWFPLLWLKWVCAERAFVELDETGFIVVETPHRDIALFPLKALDYPYPLSTVFAASSSNPSNGVSDHVQNGKSLDEIVSKLIAVDYRYQRFALDPRTGEFATVKNWADASWTGIAAMQGGLSKEIRQQRFTLFGSNLIDIEGKSIIGLLVDEIIHPFYVFQIASIILWSLDDYYYYAFCIALISVLSITSTLVETRATIARMREMSRFSCIINVLVDGSWQPRDSTELVPGDIVTLIDPTVSVFPADFLLLSGDAIVNESMLTGESVPVSKVPIKDQDLVSWRETREVSHESAKGFLYAGTRVIRVRGALVANGTNTGPCLAMVARTGFNTTKGALVRSMLFPKPLGFKFYRDSMRFIGVLAGIAGLGFMASAVQFVRLGVKWHTILVRALDLITVVVPPALPATLSIGTSFALGRLRKSGIFCISPNRVNVSGKVNVCCFDKTGTLTEDGLDILGVRAVDWNHGTFRELIDDVHDLPLSTGAGRASFLQALATCHMLRIVDSEIVGDPLDVKMFNFTQWTLEEGQVAGTGVIKDKASGTHSSTALVQTIVRPPGSASFRLEDALRGNTKRAHFLELGVIRTFEFVSALRRMSVIVKRLKSSSMEIYVKGAPEVMAEICDKSSFPVDYEDLLSYYTKRGYRVIAIAGKSIEGLTWLKAQRMKREQAESDLRFLGLVIFENKLKPGTAPAILALRQAHMACRMITGDNPLTAVSVARECSLIPQEAHVFAPSFEEGNASVPTARLKWCSMDEPLWRLDDYSLKPLTPPPHHTAATDEIMHQDYAVVVTGDVFRWMLTYAPLETVQRMLVKTQVFARMSPDEKNEVVERLQSLGYTVLMCGDGANDCAALKAADVGLSLSEAEASVAAPFTSRTPDISCVIEVLKEGRAALVTSFSCFKYMALYSLIQFTTITLLYSFASSLGDFQFLYIDLFIIIPIAVTMGRTLPYSKLHPKRPTASLVSTKVLASITGQILITSAVQLWAFIWIRGQTWYTPPSENMPDPNSDRLQASNYENSALFLVSCFQYILVAGVFSIGPPYRKPMWTNGLFMLTLTVIALINVVLILRPPRFLSVLLELMALPLLARLTLLSAVVVNVVLSVMFEHWGAELVAGAVRFVASFIQDVKRTRESRQYKMIDSEPR